MGHQNHVFLPSEDWVVICKLSDVVSAGVDVDKESSENSPPTGWLRDLMTIEDGWAGWPWSYWDDGTCSKFGCRGSWVGKPWEGCLKGSAWLGPGKLGQGMKFPCLGWEGASIMLPGEAVKGSRGLPSGALCLSSINAWPSMFCCWTSRLCGGKWWGRPTRLFICELFKGLGISTNIDLLSCGGTPDPCICWGGKRKCSWLDRVPWLPPGNPNLRKKNTNC